MSELTRRVGFIVVAVPLALAIVLWGGAPLAGLLAIASALAASEFFRLARAAGHEPLDGAGRALAGLLPLAVHARYLGVWQPRLSYLAAVLMLVAGLALWTRGAGGKPLGAIAVTVFGALYTGGALSFGYALRYHDYAAGGVRVGPIEIAAGAALLGLPLVLTWATDIGAYVMGRAVGGRKLIPSVSPGKTVSGSIGGVLLCIVLGWIYMRFALRPASQLALTTLGLIIFSTVISVVAQVGDLVESLFKREAGVKDSGTLIPGHGGVLDRLDSLLFALPAAHLMIGWFLIAVPR